MDKPCVITFVVALKAKALSKSWDRVCQLFEATLQSAYNQTERAFRIIIVCHDKPILRHSYDSRVEFISVDFPPPPANYDEMMLDKWKKMAVGVKRAGELTPQFVMLMDADDLISNRLVMHANAHPESNGWIIKNGFTYAFGSRWIERANDFNCGTNAIVSSRLICFPQDLKEESIKECIILRWGHTTIAEKLTEVGTPLEPLPFRGAVYITDHGDNATDIGPYGSKGSRRVRWLIHKLRNIQPLSAKLAKEFSLQGLTTTSI